MIMGTHWAAHWKSTGLFNQRPRALSDAFRFFCTRTRPARSSAETCPVRTLKAWLQVRGGRESGPLFNRMDRSVVDPQLGITGESINEIVQAAVQLIGLDPRDYGAHSLRAGMVTAAHASGASDSAIMQRSGHKSVQTLTQYIRHADPFRGGDVLREAL